MPSTVRNHGCCGSNDENGTVGARVAKLSGSVHMPSLPRIPTSSQSSSGYEDGLGRRVLAFDRETGGMLERLVLRPELAAFEQALTERMAIVAGLEDERFARPRAIERCDDRLIVVSEYLAGRRLSDIIDAAAEHGIVAGLDAGLGLLLELLPRWRGSTMPGSRTARSRRAA